MTYGKTIGQMNCTKIDKTVSWQNPRFEIGTITQFDFGALIVKQYLRGISASIDTLIVFSKRSRNSHGKVLFACRNNTKAELSYNLLS
jgi:hypothetical protein